MNVGKSLVAAAAFTLACSCAQAESPTLLLDDMRAHLRNTDAAKRQRIFLPSDSVGTVASRRRQVMGRRGGPYLKPLKRWLWDHAPK